eukprot:1156250-Pelagomonas_calceolata.AAC.5
MRLQYGSHSSGVRAFVELQHGVLCSGVLRQCSTIEPYLVVCWACHSQAYEWQYPGVKEALSR